MTPALRARLKSDIKHRLTWGHAVPAGIDPQLLAECEREVRAEAAGPGGARLLMESLSAGGGDGLPTGIHARVARMFDATHVLQESRSEPRSDLKDDPTMPVLRPPTDPQPARQQLADAVRVVAQRYREANDGRIR
jgi:hypothetical protein